MSIKIDNEYEIWQSIFIFETPWVIRAISIDIVKKIEYLVYIPSKDENRRFEPWQITAEYNNIWFKVSEW